MAREGKDQIPTTVIAVSSQPAEQDTSGEGGRGAMAHTGTRLHFYTLSRITSDCLFIFNDDVLRTTIIAVIYIYVLGCIILILFSIQVYCFKFSV